MNKKRNIILFYCVSILVLLICSGCNQRKTSEETALFTGNEATKLLFEYLYPGTDYFDNAEYIEENNYIEYRFSLPNDGKTHIRRIVYYDLPGNYHRFEFYTDNFSHDLDGNYEYTNTNFYSGFAVSKVTGEILQERYDTVGGMFAYSEKYYALLAQEENEAESIQIVLSEDDIGNAVLAGRNRNGEKIYINLDYPMADVIVKDSYYVDLTGDDNAELCIELNIQNTTSSDMNTILIYHLENQELLFPNEGKKYIYDGKVVDLDLDKVILYKNLDKINGTVIESEYSLIKWNGNDFETMKYYKKLLAKTDEYLLFYDKTEEFSETYAFKLLVLDPESLEIIQEIKVVPDKEIDTVKKINQGNFVVADNAVGKETANLYVEEYGILRWDGQEKVFETVPLSPTEEEIEKIFYQDRLESFFDTYVCYPRYQGAREDFIKEYLEAHEIYKEEPDGINERNGRKCSEYYINEEKQRISFIIYKNWYKNIRDENEELYPDCIYGVTVDRDSLLLQGYLVNSYGENGELVYQRSYDSEGILEAYISYEYTWDIPFPIITNFEEYVEYPQVGINNGCYFDFYKEDMLFDERGRWCGYSSCFLDRGETNHYNVCDYNSQGKLEAIREVLLEEDKVNNFNRDYSGEILLEYSEAEDSIMLEYWGSNNTHWIGSGISGEMEYDDKGRVISWSFINGDVFLIYDGDSRNPWARITISGNPYSSYGVRDGIAYGHNTNVYLFQPD